MIYDVVILGAGAAGLMCAAECGKRRRKTVILEKSQKVGSKILISGGGRCNFTNLDVRSERYVSQNPHFCKSALSRYTPADFIRLVESHHIPYHEKKLGQLFCDRSARDIATLLQKECEKAGVIVRLQTDVRAVKKTDHFLVETDQGLYEASSLVIATGGLSMPQTGASDLGHRIARQFGLDVVDTAPALDGFVLPEPLKSQARDLSGVSADVTLECSGVSFRESLLFTHFGLSGPAALQGSLYWSPGSVVTVDFLPDTSAEDWLLDEKRKGSRALLKNLLSQRLPKRLAEFLSSRLLPAEAQEVSVARLSDAILKNFSRDLNQWPIVPERTVGYDRAEVTRGGVDTRELSSKTMEAKRVPGLYLIGEVVDVTGWLGGYNFQWAWASGWVAGQYA